MRPNQTDTKVKHKKGVNEYGDVVLAAKWNFKGGKFS